jgi:hypothetical protein
MSALQIGLRLRVKRLAQQIVEQHRHLDALRREVAAALEGGACADGRTALERFTAALAAHFELEQSVFFPALHGLSHARTQELEAVEAEHPRFLAALHRVAAEIETASADASERAFRECLIDLRDHEQREERLVGAIVDRS